MVKQESKIISNEKITNQIIQALNQYLKDIQTTEFEDNTVIEITSLKINLKNNNVYVIYNDYTEEQNKMQNILSEAITVKSELETELAQDKPDQVKIAILQGKLNNLAEKFDEIKPILGITYEFWDII